MTRPAIKVRDATIEDAPTIAVLSAELGYPDPGEQTVPRLKAILVSPDHAVMVASRDNGDVLGWIHVFVAHRVESDAFAELGGFVVGEESRRQGVGRHLLKKAEAWARNQGLGRLRVRTRSDRTEAHTFYEKWGFVLAKEQYVYDKNLR